MDSELFFPSSDAKGNWDRRKHRTEEDTKEERKAKAVCVMCPVQEECLKFAIVTDQEAGIWGGMSSRQRRVLRREWFRKTDEYTSDNKPDIDKSTSDV